jgi:hypothetical protein
MYFHQGPSPIVRVLERFIQTAKICSSRILLHKGLPRTTVFSGANLPDARIQFLLLRAKYLLGMHPFHHRHLSMAGSLTGLPGQYFGAIQQLF